MARIPLGNQGDVVSQAPQQVQTNPDDFGLASAQAKEQLGSTLTGIGDQMAQKQQMLNDDLQRTSAATAYQQYALNVQMAVKTAGDQLQSGQIDQTGYTKAVSDAQQQSFDSTIGPLPDTHYKRVATIQSDGLNKTVALDTQATLVKNTQQLVAANADSLLDNAGKSIAINPATIDATTAATTTAYTNAAQAAGVAPDVAQKRAESWSNGQYADHATTAALEASANSDLPALTKLQSDLTDPNGFYAGKMDANQRNQVLSTVVTKKLSLENQLTTQQQAREAAATTAYNGALDLFAAGKQFSPAYQSQLVSSTSGTAVGPDVQNLIKTVATTSGFSSLPLPQMHAAVQANQTAANTPGVGTDPLTNAAVKQQQTMLTAAETAYKTDPWNAAVDRGGVQSIPQIDTSSIPALTASLAARATVAPQIDQLAGRTVSLLTPDEATNTLQMVKALGPDARAQVLQGIGQAFGSAGRINDLAETWKEKDPATALALKAGSGGGNGSPLITTNGQPVGAFILDGQQALTDKTVKIDDTVGTGMKATIANAINGTLPPDQADDAKESAYLIAVANAQKNGRAAPNAADVQGGIDTATGGISATTGQLPNGKPWPVARPYGWTDDQFQSSLKAATPADIENQPGGKPVDTVYANGQPIPADQFMSKFSSYNLVRVGVRGTYAVSTGSKFVTDQTGTPLTVHLTFKAP